VEGIKQIAVYDSAGRFLRTIGRRGRGPGEFLGIRHIIAIADTLFVYDNALLRRSVFADLAFVRSENLPGMIQAVVQMPDGSALVNSIIRSQDRIGLPIHLLSSAGRIVKSFGPTDPFFKPDAEILELRRIAAGGGGPVLVWTSPVNEYVISGLATDGRVVVTLSRRADWFPAWTQPARFGERPNPEVVSLALDAENPELLWVSLIVRDPKWRAPNAPGRRTQARADSTYDTIFEVWDLKQRAPIAARREEPQLPGITADGFVPRLRITASGQVELDILKPTLIRN
jgi:hypothetical protein